MAKPKNTDGSIDELGVLITAAFGLDTGWMQHGACHDWGSNRPGHPTPWQVAPGRRYGPFKGTEMVKYALIICSGCPAQYDCAKYAVDGLMDAGTWSMPITQLRWLRKQAHAHDLIEFAREAELPMQNVAVTVTGRSNT